MADRLNGGADGLGGKWRFRGPWDAKIAAGKMTAEDWCDRGNAQAASIGRNDILWTVVNGRPTIGWRNHPKVGA